MVKSSFLFLALAAILVFGLELAGPDGPYQFGGHGTTLSWISKGVTVLLCVTHVFLAFVMWVRRMQWRVSEAAMFRFIAFKSLFWGYLVYYLPISNRGIALPYFALIVLMALATLDLDIKLFGRYVLGWEDDDHGTNHAPLIDNETIRRENIV